MILYHALTCTDDECDPSCDIGDPETVGGRWQPAGHDPGVAPLP